MRGFTADRSSDLRDFLGAAQPIETRHQRGLQGRGNRQGSVPYSPCPRLPPPAPLSSSPRRTKARRRCARRCPADGRRQRPRASDGADHDPYIAFRQPIEHERRDVGLPDPGRVELRPESHDQKCAKGPDAVHDAAQRFEARRVRPMRVLEDHQHRTEIASEPPVAPRAPAAFFAGAAAARGRSPGSARRSSATACRRAAQHPRPGSTYRPELRRACRASLAGCRHARTSRRAPSLR